MAGKGRRTILDANKKCSSNGRMLRWLDSTDCELPATHVGFKSLPADSPYMAGINNLLSLRLWWRNR